MNRREPPQEDSLQSVAAQSRQIVAVVAEYNALERVPGLLAEHFTTSDVFLVADENTMAAAGGRLEKILAESGFGVTAHKFPGTPRLKAKVENAEAFLPALMAGDAVPVAVGSGVVNDLVKYAAFKAGRPYASIATAASMDGYASGGSPLSQKGFKHTIPCAPPRIIVADLDIISHAPVEMSSWGYGDLAGKIPAGADWLIADTLGVEPLDATAWAMVQGNLRDWLSNPSGVARGEAAAVRDLFTGLVTAGIAMEVHGSSRPASGADHQVAHLWEMDGIQVGGLPVSHGICVAIGALTVLSLYEWLLDQDFQDLDVDRLIAGRRKFADLEAEIHRRFPTPAIAERTLVETRAKYVDDHGLKARLETVRRTWPALRRRLSEFLIPFDVMEDMLESAGVLTRPAAVGIDPAYHRETLLGARLIRRRYTILDFLEETGRLKAAVNVLFSHGGRWGPKRR